MSLQGTLETIPLPDVLALLAATRKSGELRVAGSRGNGRVWMRDGSVVGADVPRAATPVDAVFELLRLTAGTFSFEADTPAPDPGAPLAVEGLVAEATKRLGEWRAIEAVVPSTACLVALSPELAAESVTVSRTQWKELVAVATGRDVTGVMQRLGIGEFDACRTVKELVDAGLVTIEAAPAPAAPAPEARAPEVRPSGAAQGPPGPGSDTGSGSSGRRPASSPAPAQAPASVATPPPAPRPTAPPEAAAAPRPAPPARRPTPAPVDPRRTPAQAPSAEEAEELVHQLASLARPDAQATARPAAPADGGGKAPGRPARPAATTSGGKAAPATPAPDGEATPEATADAEAERPAAPAQDDPINRGMLLKFLSSVRP